MLQNRFIKVPKMFTLNLWNLQIYLNKQEIYLLNLENQRKLLIVIVMQV